MTDTASHFNYVVVGGGIAGVTCVNTLCQLHPDAYIALITPSSYLKRVNKLQRLTRLLEDLSITEQDCQTASTEWEYQGYHRIQILQRQLQAVDVNSKRVALTPPNQDSPVEWITYDKLALCTGAAPRLLHEPTCQEFILAIRDVESVEYFQEKLTKCRRVLLVGNGGIATELAYEIRNCELIWAVKDSSINTTYLDESAATFLLSEWRDTHNDVEMCTPDTSASGHSSEGGKQCVDSQGKSYEVHSIKGSALGPNWARGRTFLGSVASEGSAVAQRDNLHIEYSTEVTRISRNEPVVDGHPVQVQLSNGHVWHCDLVICAIGVVPQVPPISNGALGQLRFVTKTSPLMGSSEGGLMVNEQMRCHISNIQCESQVCQDIYAAGDCCTVNWRILDFSSDCPHWFQMRLWSQARQMGFRAANCMHAHFTRDEKEELALDFCFELFTHVTRIFGHKVILLGRYNAQGLRLGSAAAAGEEEECELLLRMSRGGDYVKCVMLGGRMQGCTLVGDTGLEETMENLILNQLDLTAFREDLLDPDVDIDDYFD